MRLCFSDAVAKAASARADLSKEQLRAIRRLILFPMYWDREDRRVGWLDEAVERRLVASMPREVLALALPADVGYSVSAVVEAIDWAAILQWITENLPKIIEIILTLIALF